VYYKALLKTKTMKQTKKQFMKENFYRVWVEGVVDAENVTLLDAQIIALELKNKGHDNVIIEKQMKPVKQFTKEELEIILEIIEEQKKIKAI
jgi:hypothetical protein